MRLAVALIVLLSVAIASHAQTAPATTTSPAGDGGMLDFGDEGLVIPPQVIINAHTPRTAQLLGEAYRRKEPLVWKRAQYVADMGRVGQPAAAPFLIEAMKDQSPQVRAEAARAAAMVGQPSLLPQVEKLLEDDKADVRREAVLSAARLAKDHKQPTAAIERGLADEEPQVVATAIEAAWLPEHAKQIAQRLVAWDKSLHADAADALARLKATEHLAALLRLLGGDISQRAAAVRALGELGAADQHQAVLKLLQDSHPTVRREAVAATGKLAPPPVRDASAIRMLADADPTVREAAARVLTPVPSTEALTALSAHLEVDYSPLHEATRNALSRPANPAIRDATIRMAADMLAHSNLRRREDASYVLGRLRSDAAAQQHVALLKWDAADPAKADWSLVAQAAESFGLIGEARAAEPLMLIVKASPDALSRVQRPQRDHMSAAMAHALVALARLRHQPALKESTRLLQLNADACPADVRAAAAFALGVLTPPETSSPEVNLVAMYDSVAEAKVAKFEALKALGNMRHTLSAQRLKTISETAPVPELRWIAHWSYQRCSNTRVPYTPPSERRLPPTSIVELTN